MMLQFSSIPYSPTIGHDDRSVRLLEFDQKVHELFRLRCWYFFANGLTIFSCLQYVCKTLQKR